MKPKLADANAVVLGCSPDDPAAQKAFDDKFSLSFTLLCDPAKSTMEAYGAWGEKEKDGVKKMGVIRSTVWIAPDGTVKKHWAKVTDPEGHPNDVFSALGNPA